MKRLWLFLLLPFFAAAQTTPACNPSGTAWKGTFTAAAAGNSNANNTANPNCNAFALTWNTGSPTSGVTALSIQLEGSDDNTTFTAYTGATTVLVGTNPSTALSGVIIVQASAKIAYIRARTTVVTGSGVINYQIFGYNGITAVAKSGSGGGGGGGAITQPWTAGIGGVTAGQLVCPDVVSLTTPATAVSCQVTVVGDQINASIIGVAQGSAAAGATFQVIVQGPATCAFDGVNAPIAGHLATYSISTATRGLCQDSGSGSANFGVPVAGVVVTTGAVNTTQSIWVYGPGLVGSTITAVAPMHVTNPGGLVPELFQIKAGNATAAQGTGTKLQFSIGTATTGHCVQFDATGNTVDSGAACAAGGVSSVGASAPLSSTGGTTPVISIPSGNLSTVAGSTKLVSWDGIAPVNGNCASWLNGNLQDFGGPCTGGGTIAFSAISTGLNTTAAMTVGAGASLGPVSTGTVTANLVPTSAGFTTTTNGNVSYDSTANNLKTAQNGADAIIATTPTATPVNNDCVKWVKSGSQVSLGDAGAACGSGGGSAFPLTIVQEIYFNSGSAGSTSYTFTLPFTAAASGNTMFIMLAGDGGNTFTTPTGWTIDLNTTQANNSRFVLLHKASASDTTVVFGSGGTAFWAGYFMEVSGSHALDQSTIAGQAIPGTGQFLFSAITPTVNSLVFALVAATNGAVITTAEPIFTNTISPLWRPLYSSNSVINGGRFLFGYVSSVAAANVSTRPPPIITFVSLLALSGAVVTTFSIL